MASSNRNTKGRAKKGGAWEWICTNSKKAGSAIKTGMKRTLDWLRAHPVVCHVLAISIVLVCLVVLVYVFMALGTRHNAQRTVPNFVGLSMADASHYASRRDLEIVVNDSLYVPSCPGGVVLDQVPAEGMIVKPGRKIYVTINSLDQRRAVVPYVADLSLRQAKSRLETAGFTIERLEYVEDTATNCVLAEFVNGDSITVNNKLLAYVGTGVVLHVGAAPDKKITAVPNILGFTLAEAKSRLWESGFNIGELSFDKGISIQERDEAIVHQQGLFAGSDALRGSDVSLSLTLSQDKVNKSIAAYEMRVETLRKEKIVADSLAQVEKRMRDSILNVNRSLLDDTSAPRQIQHTEDEFF